MVKSLIKGVKIQINLSSSQMKIKGYEKLIKKLLDPSIPFFQSLTKMLKALQQNKEIQKLVWLAEEKYSAINTFRILILIDRIINEQEVDFNQWIQVLKSLKSEAENFQDFLIEERIINPYRLFLLKYCEYRAKDKDGFISIDKEVEMFKCINLLWSAASFIEIIYVFGRYYRQFHAEIIEFNIAICKSLKKIYNQLSSKIDYFPNRQILGQIQLLHEKLYVAFYNCYFYQYVKHYSPNWIKTDQSNQQKFTISKNKNFHFSQQSTTIQSSKSQFNQSVSTFHSKSSSPNNAKGDFDSLLLLSNPVENIQIIQLQDDFLESQDQAQQNQARLELIKEMQQIVLMIND